LVSQREWEWPEVLRALERGSWSRITDAIHATQPWERAYRKTEKPSNASMMVVYLSSVSLTRGRRIPPAKTIRWSAAVLHSHIPHVARYQNRVLSSPSPSMNNDGSRQVDRYLPENGEGKNAV
jgi:hypothetical protein